METRSRRFRRERERWRATSPGDARTRRGKSGSKTQECENRLLSAFPGENGSRRGRSLPRRWQPRPDALSQNRGFNSRPPIVLSPPVAPRCNSRERNFTPYRFWIRKKIRNLDPSISFLRRKRDFSLSLCRFTSIHLPFNVTMPYRIAGICLSSDNYSSDPFSKGSLAFETRMDRLLDSEGGPVCIIQGMLRLNRPMKWRKSSLLTLATSPEDGRRTLSKNPDKILCIEMGAIVLISIDSNFPLLAIN